MIVILNILGSIIPHIIIQPTLVLNTAHVGPRAPMFLDVALENHEVLNPESNLSIGMGQLQRGVQIKTNLMFTLW